MKHPYVPNNTELRLNFDDSLVASVSSFVILS